MGRCWLLWKKNDWERGCQISSPTVDLGRTQCLGNQSRQQRILGKLLGDAHNLKHPLCYRSIQEPHTFPFSCISTSSRKHDKSFRKEQKWIMAFRGRAVDTCKSLVFLRLSLAFPFCCSLNLKEYLQIILNSWSRVSQQRDFVLPPPHRTRGKTFCKMGFSLSPVNATHFVF